MVEWSIAPVLKTGELKGSVGSNPTPSASSCGMRPKFERREAAQTAEGSPEGVEAGGRNQSHPLRHKSAKRIPKASLWDDTNVSLKLDFAPEKRGAWPSRSCGNWPTCWTLPIGPNEHGKAHRRCLRLGEPQCVPLLKSKSQRLSIWDRSSSVAKRKRRFEERTQIRS